MTPEREKRFKEVLSRRQADMTVVLENIHDPHNLFAIMRTCDSVGIQDIHVIYTMELKNTIGKRSSASARKWVNEHYYFDVESCVKVLREQNLRLLATHLSEDATSLYETDLTGPLALVMGNEKEGISDELINNCDGNIQIPQLGMIKSLNLSVATAVILYESLRQRIKGNLLGEAGLPAIEQELIFNEWKERDENR